jgi:hypothetical protein
MNIGAKIAADTSILRKKILNSRSVAFLKAFHAKITRIVGLAAPGVLASRGQNRYCKNSNSPAKLGRLDKSQRKGTGK